MKEDINVKRNAIKEKVKVALLICTFLAFFIFNAYLFYGNLLKKESIGILLKSLYFILSLILLFVSSYVLYKMHKTKVLKPEKLFLIFAISFGIIYMFATPLFKGHDELYHWQKSYAVSLLNFTPSLDKNWNGEIVLCDYLPKIVDKIYSVQGLFVHITYKSEVKSAIFSFICQCLNKGYEIVPIYDAPTAYYPAIQMLPQSLGIAFSRFLGFDVFMQAIFARLFNFITYVLLGYYAIKLIPACKYFLATFLLIPKVMYISTTMSGDVFTNAVIILYISYIFYLINKKQKLNAKEKIILIILQPLVAINKLVYLPICFLVLLLPKACFKGKKNSLIFKISLIIFALIVSFSWLKISSSFLESSVPTTKQQINYIINNPISYSKTLILESIHNFKNWSLDIVGGYMEWGANFSLNQVISIYVYLVLLFSYIFETNKTNLKPFQKLFILVIFICVVVLIETALYVQWSSQLDGIGKNKITGVQGRYFTPIFILLILVLSHKFKFIDKFLKKFESNKKFSFYALGYLMILWQIPTLLSIIVRNI